jgi:hypothetical protein
MIQTDDQMLLAQQRIGNVRRVLLEARKTHSFHRTETRFRLPALE